MKIQAKPYKQKTKQEKRTGEKRDEKLQTSYLLQNHNVRTIKRKH
jgi:hypothetical protein